MPTEIHTKNGVIMGKRWMNLNEDEGSDNKEKKEIKDKEKPNNSKKDEEDELPDENKPVIKTELTGNERLDEFFKVLSNYDIDIDTHRFSSSINPYTIKDLKPEDIDEIFKWASKELGKQLLNEDGIKILKDLADNKLYPGMEHIMGRMSDKGKAKFCKQLLADALQVHLKDIDENLTNWKAYSFHRIGSFDKDEYSYTEGATYPKDLISERKTVLGYTSDKQREYLINSKMYYKQNIDKLSDEEIKKKVLQHLDMLLVNGDFTPKEGIDTNGSSLYGIAEKFYNRKDTNKYCRYLGTEQFRKDRLKSLQDFYKGAEKDGNKIWQAIREFTTFDFNDDKKVTKILNDFIENTPSFNGTLYRGLNKSNKKLDEMLENLKVGSTYTPTLDKIHSYSNVFSKALNFTNGSKPVIIECVGNKTATPITDWSNHHDELEVIAHSKARYTVTDIFDDRGTIFIKMIEQAKLADD